MNLKINQINLLNFPRTPKLVKQVTIPVYQINYQRKGVFLVITSQLQNKPGCEVSPSTIHGC